jgi:hypothetical protein
MRCPLLVAACSLTTLTASLPAQTNLRDRFFKDARAELALARARGESTVVLTIASREGENEAVVAAITRAKGTVRYRADDVSYIRATIPTDRALEVVGSAPIETATIDVKGSPTRPYLLFPGNATGYSSRDDGGSRSSQSVEHSFPSRLARGDAATVQIDTIPGWLPKDLPDPLNRPYSPLADMGALELRKKNPTYDGRGVVVGHVEGHIDILAPEFKTAYSIDGKRINKFADYLTAEDPEYTEGASDSFNPWVKVDPVTASGGRFTVSGKTYSAPRDGQFRFGVFNNKRLCGFLNRKDYGMMGVGDTTLNCPYGVLFDQTTKEVWVDTNGDLSFADSRPMRDFKVADEFGVFGTDDPSTPADREAFGFAVQTHPSNRYVGILVGFGGHSTMVAGTTIGNREPNGRYEGIAPGAQIVEVGYRDTPAGVTEGLIMAFRDPRTDLVLFEQNVFIVAPYRLGDGRFPTTIITSRLIKKYNKPFCVPGDNNPGLNVISEHGNAQWGFAVGAYQGKDSWWINDWVKLTENDNLHHVGSWGPGGDGSVKPSVLAPSNIISSALPSRFYAHRGGKKGLYGLPPGYSIGGGTSQATPSMAGALALLISSAKQAKVPYDAERIWLAMTNGARHIPHLPIYKQGNGVVNVEGAFELLKAFASRPPTIHVTSRAPVKTAYSEWHVTPNEGVGLWEREGWRAGQRGERTITLTRTSGSSDASRFSLSWTGNDGTFTAPTEVTLPLNTPTRITVGIAPKKSGAHSAILNIDHPSVAGHVHRVMTTIVAAEELNASNKFTVAITDTVEPPGPQESYFIYVPPGLSTLELKVDTKATNVSLGYKDPLGRESWGSRTFRNPMSGVWEVGVGQGYRGGGIDILWEYGDTLAPKIGFTVTARAYGAEATLSTEGTSGPPTGRQLSITNAGAPFNGEAVASALAHGMERSERIALNEQRVYDIDVPEGARSLGVMLRSQSSDSDLDLYLYDCTGKSCAAVATEAGPGNEGTLWRDRPTKGRWRVVVDAPRAPQSGATYTLTDVIIDPSLGSLVVADAPKQREASQRWSVPAYVWKSGAVPAGRSMYIVLQANAGAEALRVIRKAVKAEGR